MQIWIKKKDVFKWVFEEKKKTIGARDNLIRFPQTMVLGNGGQQELCITVLGAIEANKINIVSGRSLRTFVRTKEKMFWFLGCITARNVAVREVERINEN